MKFKLIGSKRSQARREAMISSPYCRDECKAILRTITSYSSCMFARMSDSLFVFSFITGMADITWRTSFSPCYICQICILIIWVFQHFEQNDRSRRHVVRSVLVPSAATDDAELTNRFHRTFLPMWDFDVICEF
jgi:hypothetical protein